MLLDLLHQEVVNLLSGDNQATHLIVESSKAMGSKPLLIVTINQATESATTRLPRVHYLQGWCKKQRSNFKFPSKTKIKTCSQESKEDKNDGCFRSSFVRVFLTVNRSLPGGFFKVLFSEQQSSNIDIIK